MTATRPPSGDTDIGPSISSGNPTTGVDDRRPAESTSTTPSPCPSRARPPSGSTAIELPGWSSDVVSPTDVTEATSNSAAVPPRLIDSSLVSSRKAFVGPWDSPVIESTAVPSRVSTRTVPPSSEDSAMVLESGEKTRSTRRLPDALNRRPTGVSPTGS